MKKRTKAKPWKQSWTAHFNVPTAAFPGHIIKTTAFPHLPIALIWEGGGTHGKPQAIANTHLMTAAPDMLSFITNLRELAADGQDAEIVAELRGAYCTRMLKKAEGRA